MATDTSPKGLHYSWNVLVVGAGPAGLAIAAACQDAGFKVVILEQSEVVGGRTCIAGCSGFQEGPLKSYLDNLEGYQEGVRCETTVKDTNSYFASYAAYNNLQDHIWLSCQLTHLAADPGAGEQRRWLVTYRDLATGLLHRAAADFVVLCTGHGLPEQEEDGSRPSSPRGEPDAAPGTRRLHVQCATVDDVPAFHGTVTVLGDGAAAVDCASALALLRGGKGVGLVVRQSEPSSSTNPSRHLDGSALLDSARRRALHAAMQPHYTCPASGALGRAIKAPTKRRFWALLKDKAKAAVLADHRAGASGSPRTSINSEIEQPLSGSGCTRLLVWAPSFSDPRVMPFLDPALRQALLRGSQAGGGGGGDGDGGAAGSDLVLYRGVLPPDVRGLAFVGYEAHPGTSMLVLELQAQWLVAHLTSRLPLPAPAAMRADVAAQRSWRSAALSSHLMSAGGSLAARHEHRYVQQLLADLQGSGELRQLPSPRLIPGTPVPQAAQAQPPGSVGPYQTGSTATTNLTDKPTAPHSANAAGDPASAPRQQLAPAARVSAVRTVVDATRGDGLLQVSGERLLTTGSPVGHPDGPSDASCSSASRGDAAPSDPATPTGLFRRLSSFLEVRVGGFMAAKRRQDKAQMRHIASRSCGPAMAAGGTGTASRYPSGGAPRAAAAAAAAALATAAGLGRGGRRWSSPTDVPATLTPYLPSKLGRASSLLAAVAAAGDTRRGAGARLRQFAPSRPFSPGAQLFRSISALGGPRGGDRTHLALPGGRRPGVRRCATTDNVMKRARASRAAAAAHTSGNDPVPAGGGGGSPQHQHHRRAPSSPSACSGDQLTSLSTRLRPMSRSTGVDLETLMDLVADDDAGSGAAAVAAATHAHPQSQFTPPPAKTPLRDQRTNQRGFDAQPDAAVDWSLTCPALELAEGWPSVPRGLPEGRALSNAEWSFNVRCNVAAAHEPNAAGERPGDGTAPAVDAGRPATPESGPGGQPGSDRHGRGRGSRSGAIGDGVGAPSPATSYQSGAASKSCMTAGTTPPQSPFGTVAAAHSQPPGKALLPLAQAESPVPAAAYGQLPYRGFRRELLGSDRFKTDPTVYDRLSDCGVDGGGSDVFMLGGRAASPVRRGRCSGRGRTSSNGYTGHTGASSPTLPYATGTYRVPETSPPADGPSSAFGQQLPYRGFRRELRGSNRFEIDASAYDIAGDNADDDSRRSTGCGGTRCALVAMESQLAALRTHLHNPALFPFPAVATPSSPLLPPPSLQAGWEGAGGVVAAELLLVQRSSVPVGFASPAAAASGGRSSPATCELGTPHQDRAGEGPSAPVTQPPQLPPAARLPQQRANARPGFWPSLPIFVKSPSVRDRTGGTHPSSWGGGNLDQDYSGLGKPMSLPLPPTLAVTKPCGAAEAGKGADTASSAAGMAAPPRRLPPKAASIGAHDVMRCLRAPHLSSQMRRTPRSPSYMVVQSCRDSPRTSFAAGEQRTSTTGHTAASVRPPLTPNGRSLNAAGGGGQGIRRQCRRRSTFAHLLLLGITGGGGGGVDKDHGGSLGGLLGDAAEAAALPYSQRLASSAESEAQAHGSPHSGSYGAPRSADVTAPMPVSAAGMHSPRDSGASGRLLPGVSGANPAPQGSGGRGLVLPPRLGLMSGAAAAAATAAAAAILGSKCGIPDVHGRGSTDAPSVAADGAGPGTPGKPQGGPTEREAGRVRGSMNGGAEVEMLRGLLAPPLQPVDSFQVGPPASVEVSEKGLANTTTAAGDAADIDDDQDSGSDAGDSGFDGYPDFQLAVSLRCSLASAAAAAAGAADSVETPVRTSWLAAQRRTRDPFLGYEALPAVGLSTRAMGAALECLMGLSPVDRGLGGNTSTGTQPRVLQAADSAEIMHDALFTSQKLAMETAPVSKTAPCVPQPPQPPPLQQSESSSLQGGAWDGAAAAPVGRRPHSVSENPFSGAAGAGPQLYRQQQQQQQQPRRTWGPQGTRTPETPVAGRHGHGSGAMQAEVERGVPEAVAPVRGAPASLTRAPNRRGTSPGLLAPFIPRDGGAAGPPRNPRASAPTVAAPTVDDELLEAARWWHAKWSWRQCHQARGHSHSQLLTADTRQLQQHQQAPGFKEGSRHRVSASAVPWRGLGSGGLEAAAEMEAAGAGGGRGRQQLQQQGGVAEASPEERTGHGPAWAVRRATQARQDQLVNEISSRLRGALGRRAAGRNSDWAPAEAF